MSDRCPNCNQPVLESDTICWHCGWQLPEREPKQPEPETVQATEEERPYPLSAVVIYAALTIVIIVATLLVMRSLGQKPLGAGESKAQPGREWVSVTNENQTFAKPTPLLLARSQDLNQVSSADSRPTPACNADENTPSRLNYQQSIIYLLLCLCYARAPISTSSP